MMLLWGSNLKFRKTPYGNITFVGHAEFCALAAKQTDVGSQQKPGQQHVLLSACSTPYISCLLWLLASKMHQLHG